MMDVGNENKQHFLATLRNLDIFLKNMVLTRNGFGVSPAIKEVTFISGLSTPPKLTSKVSELPSLRYGSLGARNNVTGPLKVTSSYHQQETLLKSARKTNRRYSTYPSDDPLRAPLPPRRVRFTLPPDVPRGAPPERRTGRGGGGSRHRAPDATVGLQVIERISSRSSWRKQHEENKEETAVPVTASPGVRDRIHPTGRYIRGTLSPTSVPPQHAAASLGATPSPEGQALLGAARDGDDHQLKELIRKAILLGITETDLNAVDSSGRTVLSYIASYGTIDILELVVKLPGLDPNKPDNEGNTPLHFAAQAGQLECLSCLLSRCKGINIDAKNNLGFTPLMKAALQGRNKCAKILLFAGANPTLRDSGRGFRADQWARFCGRYVCADVIEKHARQRLLERSTSYGHWGCDPELGARLLMGKVVPVPPVPQHPPAQGLKSRLRRVFRTSSTPSDGFSSARLVTQLTSAALCASSPVLPPGSKGIPPVVKSLLRPLTVPKLQITLVNNNGDHPNHNIVCNGGSKTPADNNMTGNGVGHKVIKETRENDRGAPPIIKLRSKKKNQ